MAYHPKVQLYRGTAPVNLGYVSDYHLHLGGNTSPYGWTFDAADTVNDPSEFIEIFAGVADGVNNREVSPNSLHKGGATRSIGYLSLQPRVPGMFKVLVNTSNNNGTGTSDDGFQGGTTDLFGYSLPNDTK